jgi:predicted alpha/beta superfamily hydrolase
MSRLRIALFLVSYLIATASLQTQAQSKTKSHPTTPPGTDTITSFDKEHTVIGWLEIVPMESKIYHEKRLLRVLVPANYFSPHNAHRSYPVLYMQNGEALFDEATSQKGEWHMDETVEHLVGGFKIPPMFVVGIDDMGARTSPDNSSAPQAENGKASAHVDEKERARFLLTEVMPFIEKYYRVSRGTINTGLGGSLENGDVAIYTALEHPGIFGQVLVESPVLGSDDNRVLKAAEAAKALPRKIYIAMGIPKDADAQPNTDAVKNVQELESVLRKKGMTGSRLKIVMDTGGENNEAAWSHRLPDALLFLYGQ